MKALRTLCIISFFWSPFLISMQQQPLKMAIVGFGGRAQWMLVDCLKHKERDIELAAIADDNASACIDTITRRLDMKKDSSLSERFKRCLSCVTLYRNTPDALQTLCHNHKDLDVLWIMSANNDHYWQLKTILEHSNARRIFMEKPLFRSLEEWNAFDFETPTRIPVMVGLTLRYSSMARIVKEKLQQHKDQLGSLTSAKAWEYLNFSHALTAFIMGGWRRSAQLSGGFMVEKVIHDMDLALFFLDALGLTVQNTTVESHADHRFFIKSRKQEILDFAISHPHLFPIEKYKPWQPYYPIRNSDNSIDWNTSLDRTFENYPDNNNFSGRDIIPDYQKLIAHMQTTQNHRFDFELEVAMGPFKPQTERAQQFIFKNGIVMIDIMASCMRVDFNDGTRYTYDLQTNNNDHADGDKYIVDSLMGISLPNGYSMAMINDPLVKLAHQIILTAEKLVENGKH